MSLLIDPREQIVGMFNKENNTTVTWDQLTVESLSNNIVPDTENKNTMLTVSYGVYDPMTIYYDRYSIKDAVAGNGRHTFGLPMTATGKVRDLVPYINERFGLNLTPNEVAVTTYQLPNGTAFNIDVVITESFMFTAGSILELTVPANYYMINGRCCLKAPMLLSNSSQPMNPDIFQVRNTGGGDYGAYGTNRVAGWTMTAPVDYSPIAHILRNIVAVRSYSLDYRVITSQAGIWGQFCAAVRSVDGNPWVIYSGSVNYNLYGSSVVYNGPIEGAAGLNLRTYEDIEDAFGVASWGKLDKRFDNVLILHSISGYMNGNMKVNHLYFHYNN